MAKSSPARIKYREARKARRAIDSKVQQKRLDWEKKARV
ncbi:hypothetical protein UFOVP1264_67 [uncultured Caudovirales phage]|uniref:Uncharacterized protein n=1 Tax=uncultured Caudovirales phage TaxID=2100421 RepID=A0A6J5RF67_9CAUD|nr:hypothetical protein UFOVP1264_67 [uncultured Caudovirales phage]